MPTAIITGASRGLGLALADALADRGWRLVIDGRDGVALEQAAARLRGRTDVVALAGDVADPWHRSALVEAAHDDAGEAHAGDERAGRGRIDLLVNNASRLGPSPQPALAAYPLDELERVYRVNVIAPLALAQLALPRLAPAGRVVNVTSDAAVEPYPGWGGYGASKAALEHASRILAVERPDLRVLAVDPGDMRTEMHQDAFPGDDISDRPEPETRVPALLRLIEGDLPSGRYEANAFVAAGPRQP